MLFTFVPLETLTLFVFVALLVTDDVEVFTAITFCAEPAILTFQNDFLFYFFLFDYLLMNGRNCLHLKCSRETNKLINNVCEFIYLFHCLSHYFDLNYSQCLAVVPFELIAGQYSLVVEIEFDSLLDLVAIFRSNE